MPPKIRPFDDLMRQELIRANFDFDRPRPAAAWEAFKLFIRQPIPGQQTVTVGFTCCNIADRDRTLWLEFARQLKDDAGFGHNCGCAFSRPVPDDLRAVDKGNWWWPQHGSLDQWIRDVETIPEFIRCVALPDWRFEGYSL